MSDVDRNEGSEAFERVLEEIESAANALNEAGASAFRAGDYDKARAAIEEATGLAECREKVKALQKEWLALLAEVPPQKRRTARKAKGRLPRGLPTPEEAFRRPILEALVELGGSAPLGDVLDKVELKMKGRAQFVRQGATSLGSALNSLEKHCPVVPQHARAQGTDEKQFSVRYPENL